jgi:hypothetical protein
MLLWERDEMTFTKKANEITEDGTMTALYPDTREVLGPPAPVFPSPPADQAVAARP